MMQNIEFDSSTHKRYWISEYSNITIPLPPLKVQEKIVKELEEYQTNIDEYKKLIEATKQKIADKIQTVWSSK